VKASGAHAVADPRSAAMSAAPSIRRARRGVAAAIASTAARPRALSIKPISRVSLPAAVVVSGKNIVDESHLPVGARFFSTPYNDSTIVEAMMGMLSGGNEQHL
jgi:hypothetical protein